MKTLKINVLFSIIIIVVFSTVRCQYLIPHFIDEEPFLNEINDTVFFDMYKKALLLDVSNKKGMFLKISDNVDSLLIQKNKMYVKSNGQYFVYSNDTISEIKKENVKGINFKPIDFYISSE